jgi:hypothetical protein
MDQHNHAELNHSFMSAHNYPKNLILRAAGSSDLDDYYQRLENESDRLFCEDDDTLVHVLESNTASTSLVEHRITNEADMLGLVHVPNPNKLPDPAARYV